METTKLVQAFEKELNLTEQGFIKLTEQKQGLVIDVKTPEGFKLARKERTERNKTIEGVDRLAIDGKAAVDQARNILKERIADIYAPIVTAFEAEDARQKEEKRRKEQAEAERIQKIHDQINSIRQFATNLFGKSSEELQGIIEAVDMIDVSENFSELTQEAMAVKKETLAELNQALSAAIQNEQLEIERENLRQERKVQEEKNRINELKAKAQERLNNLIMIPSAFYGKSSEEINKKIYSLSNYEVKEEEFGELFNQANVSKEQVIQQLNMMFDHQLSVEKAQDDERAKVEAEQAQKYQEDMAQAQVDTNKAIEPLAEKMTSENARIPCDKNGQVLEEKPVEQRLAERFKEPKPDGEKPLTKKDQMVRSLNFWKNEYSIRDNEFNDLMNIINQYI